MKPQTIDKMEQEQAEDAKRFAPCKNWPKREKRSIWKWLISLLPLILLLAVSALKADTWTVDQWGRVRHVSFSPEGYDLWLPIYNPIFPRSTPAPTPSYCTPRPVGPTPAP